MKIETKSIREISPKELAKSLLGGTPEEIGEFFFSLSESNLGKKEKMLHLAKVMANPTGYNRTNFLRELLKCIDYVEGKEIYENRERKE